MAEYEKPSDWLKNEIGSHDFVNILKLGDLLNFGINLVLETNKDGEIEGWLWKEGKLSYLPIQRQDEFERSISHDPRGGWSNPDVPAGSYGFSGFALSSTLVTLLLDEIPESGQYGGRGTSFRADIAQLERNGF